MVLRGVLKLKKDIQVISDKFSKREVVLVTQEQYPQTIIVEFLGVNCDLIDSYEIGDELDFFCGLRGREWNSPLGEVKYFNTIVCSGVQKVSVSESIKEIEVVSAEIQEDLPF